MNRFVFNIPSFDNLDAHEQVRNMMLRKENLKVKFDTDAKEYPYAKIESVITSIIYRLNEQSKLWLLEYLNKGEADDLDVSPEVIHPIRTVSYQVDILGQIILSGANWKIVPKPRERNKYISIMVLYKFGKVFFRIPRTGELVSYLKSKNLPYQP